MGGLVGTVTNIRAQTCMNSEMCHCWPEQANIVPDIKKYLLYTQILDDHKPIEIDPMTSCTPIGRSCTVILLPRTTALLLAGGDLAREKDGSKNTSFDWLDSWSKILSFNSGFFPELTQLVDFYSVKPVRLQLLQTLTDLNKLNFNQTEVKFRVEVAFTCFVMEDFTENSPRKPH